MERIESVSIGSARRIALAAQGFSTSRPIGRVDRRHLAKSLGAMGVIQIDSVNVLVRSQELPLFARLGSHPRHLIPHATANGELFEYWGHAAAHLPTADHRLWRWKMEASVGGPWRSIHDLRRRRPGYIESILERVRTQGAVTAGELSERTERKGPWWDWDDAKEALEYLFMSGQLTATRRGSDFARVYDLPHRVIPREHLKSPTPSRADAHRELLDKAGRSLGIATAYDLADYYRLQLSESKGYIEELVEAGRLRRVRVEGWKEVAFLHIDAREPRRVDAMALLSMFDPVVWNRRRDERLFDFHYRIEIYTPAPKRTFGYYVLPFLFGERIAARVDLKADRVSGALMASGLFAEEGVDRRRVAVALADELRLMADWLALDEVKIGRRGDLADPVRRILKGR
jgi:uncharacterized protein